jgi:hypothetical protein
MLANDQVDMLICELATWDRQMLTHQFLAFESRFPLDVTPEFLSGLTEEQIRHLFLAVCVQNQKLPEAVMMLV